MNFQLLLLIFTFGTAITIENGCTIDINNLPEKHPWFLTLGNNDVIYPEPTTSTIIFEINEQFELDCPGGGYVQANELTFGRTVQATCISNDLIYIEDSEFPINSVVCSKRITAIARFTSNICWKYREIEVGFELPKQIFFRLFTSCFDDISKNVVYTKFQLTKEIGQQIQGGSRPGWTEGNFYNLSVKMNSIYPKASQRVSINRQLGLSDGDTTYVKSTGNFYISIGHLVAKTDFIYDCEQQATFFYINSAPQWQTFNAQNWFYLERNLRDYAALKYITLTVYTGTYGISTLPHKETGEETELYLFVGEQEGPVIPIPELFWKVAYDPEHKAGVAVVGINNPYQTNLTNSIICNDISKEISWLNFELQKIESGYMFACEVNELRIVIPEIPNIEVIHLLTD